MVCPERTCRAKGLCQTAAGPIILNTVHLSRDLKDVAGGRVVVEVDEEKLRMVAPFRLTDTSA